MKPLVSICCLTYNHGEFIREFLSRIVVQKVNFDFEVLIYDDGSIDNAPEIIREYQLNFPDIVKPILNNTNQFSQGVRGLNIKYNFSRATGKYIALCEGDDYWLNEDKLQEQVEFLESNTDFAGCYHDTLVEYNNEQKPDHLFRENLKSIMNVEDTIASIAPFHTSSFMFVRSAFNVPDWLYEIKSGDMATFTIIAASGYLGFVPNILSVYRKHETGITNSTFITNSYHEDRIKLIKHFDQFHNFKFSEKASDVIQFHQSRLETNKSKSTSKFKKLLKRIIPNL